MKIAVVSGSRADRGALEPVARALNAVWVMLDPLPSADGAAAAANCGLAMAEATKQFQAINPDLVILPGDRFEILGAACAAHLMQIPIAHIAGGDETYGSLDNSMRHAITKLASIHFATSFPSAANLIVLGEELWRICVTGYPGLDNLTSMELLPKDEVLRRLGVADPFYLIAYQPATLSKDPVEEARQLVAALAIEPHPVVFTTLNADPYGQEISDMFESYCTTGMGFMAEMDRQLYLSAMKHCKVMIGNSSSGFYEAPSLKKPFVNIGDRQKGRIEAESILSVKGIAADITTAIAMAQHMDCTNVQNPYGDGHATERIMQALQKLPEKTALLHKRPGAISWSLTKSGKESIMSAVGGATQKRNSFDGWQDALDATSIRH